MTRFFSGPLDNVSWGISSLVEVVKFDMYGRTEMSRWDIVSSKSDHVFFPYAFGQTGISSFLKAAISKTHHFPPRSSDNVRVPQ
ncbi:hypothetical protein TNCV_4458591 [Trichonephila clavipes]|nr:hypothetical protein TNCV_4458591 [Trichonephila clavipes]